MGNLTRYTTADLPALMDRITKNSIGMDEYFDRLFNLHETTSNYPPYNLVTISEVESRLELALAGVSKRKKSMSIHKTVNSLSKVRKKIKKRKLTTSTKVWLNGHLHEHGHSLMTRKLDQLILRMGF